MQLAKNKLPQGFHKLPLKETLKAKSYWNETTLEVLFQDTSLSIWHNSRGVVYFPILNNMCGIFDCLFIVYDTDYVHANDSMYAHKGLVVTCPPTFGNHICFSFFIYGYKKSTICCTYLKFYTNTDFSTVDLLIIVTYFSRLIKEESIFVPKYQMSHWPIIQKLRVLIYSWHDGFGSVNLAHAWVKISIVFIFLLVLDE